MKEKFNILIDEIYNKKRVDFALSDYIAQQQLAVITRTRLQNLIEQGHLSQVVKGQEIVITQASHKVKTGECYIVTIPPLVTAEPEAQEIPLDIVYEDDDLLVLNKPVGMVVHPAPGHSDNTLVNALLSHCESSLSGIGGVKRPGIVHRLDKDTSGLMVIAKHDEAHHKLSAQFSSRKLTRTYWAIVWGHFLNKEGIIDQPIGRSPHNRQKMAVVTKGGKEAVTHFQVLESFTHIPLQTSLSLIECSLKTGRTHQIRVHLTELGHPLLGDPVYGKTPKDAAKKLPAEIVNFHRQCLHAKEIEFIHPRSGERMYFEVPLPEDMDQILTWLQNNKRMV